MKLKLADLIGSKDYILDKAFKHPSMKIKPRAANPYPSLDTALRATVNAIEYNVMENVAAQMTPKLEAVLTNMILMEGDYEDAEDQASWESALDDDVEEAIEPFVETCSQDWLGVNTIGSGLQLEKGVEKFVGSLGREVFKQLTYALEKSPAKIMSAAGIVTKDVEARLELHNTKEPDMTDTATLDSVIEKIALYVGKDYDVMEVYDALDLASDDDDGLAFGAGARIGLEESDVEALRNERLIYGNDTPDILAEKLAAAVKGGKKKAAPKKEAAPKAPKKTKAESDEKKAASEGAVSAETLKRLKDACAFKEADVAAKLGFSRATFNNHLNGKSSFVPTEEQASALREEIVSRTNMLLQCLAELDGLEEAHEVF